MNVEECFGSVLHWQARGLDLVQRRMNELVLHQLLRVVRCKTRREHLSKCLVSLAAALLPSGLVRRVRLGASAVWIWLGQDGLCLWADRLRHRNEPGRHMMPRSLSRQRRSWGRFGI